MYNCEDLAWNEIYNIGDEQIDEEHRKIFAIAQKLTLYKDNNDKIIQLVKELLNYTKLHFKNEEYYMQSIDYPHLKEHKILHALLIKELNEFLKTLASLTYEQIAQKMHYFIKIKIVPHILLEDKKLQHFQNDKTKIKASFQWKNAYNVGDALIDAEHKRLFAIANKALNYSYYPNMQKRLKETLKELYEYIKTHFAHEESYMQKMHFPKLEEHKVLHEKIVDSFHEFLKELPKMSQSEFEMRLIEYIDLGFINHIVVEDSKVACFVKKKRHVT
jgi:hemerythrin